MIARRVFRIPSWRLTSPFGVDTTAFAEGEPGSETCNQRLTRLSPRASSRVAARQRTGGSASQTVICGESRGRPSIHATPPCADSAARWRLRRPRLAGPRLAE